MSKSKKVRPVNSLLFISDSDGGEGPEWVRGEQILATSSCISVACYPEQDGPTEITLGGTGEVDPGWHPVFAGELETPSRTVIVSTVDHDTILESTVPKERTHVTIWVSHPRWPDRVVIGLN
jgi:hypothetical protein